MPIPYPPTARPNMLLAALGPARRAARQAPGRWRDGAAEAVALARAAPVA